MVAEGNLDEDDDDDDDDGVDEDVFNDDGDDDDEDDDDTGQHQGTATFVACGWAGACRRLIRRGDDDDDAKMRFIGQCEGKMDEPMNGPSDRSKSGLQSRVASD